MSTQGPPAQRVSWFELFYDLVLVAAISQAGKVYVKDPSWEMTGLIAGGVLVLFTVWLLTTLGYGVFRRDSAARRMTLLVQMLAVIVAALSLGKYGLADWIGYLAIAIAMGTQAFICGLYARAHEPLSRVLRTVAWAAAISAVVFAVAAGLMASEAISITKLGSAALLAVGCLMILVPLIWKVIPGVLPSLDLHHLDERFGLLVIIVLGESFINLVGNLGSMGGIPNPFAFVLTFLVTYGLWSIYFSSVQAYEMPRSAGGLRLWVVAHFLLVASLLSVAVEFTDLSTHSFEDLDVMTNGNWTPLPMVGAIASVALMTWRAKAAPRGMVVTHLVAIAVLALLTIVDLVRGVEKMPWLAFAGVFVVIADAVTCAVIRRQPAGLQERDTAAAAE